MPIANANPILAAADPGAPEAEPWESRDAIWRIASALPPVERAYAFARFGIFRTKFLALMNLALPDEGRLLDIGCGFGLFSLYFALVNQRRTILGIDPDARRVAMARKVAAQLGIADRVEYRVGTAEALPLGEPYQGVYMLDVLHHVAPDDQLPLLRGLRRLVAPGGTLLIKDVTTDAPLGLAFTWLLDRLMVGWKEPLTYRSHQEWSGLLRGLGFSVRTVRVPDVLPYPHVVMLARLPAAA